MLTICPEEAEELAFVPSATSEPRGAIYFYDNRCSEEAIRHWQFASVVVEEGGPARTVNLCQQRAHERRVQQGEPRLNSWQWRQSWRRRRIVEKFGEWWETSKSHVVCGSILLVKGQKRKGFVMMLREKKQGGIQGQWQQESPFREILEQARRNEDMRCSSEVVRKGHIAIRNSG